MTDAPAAFTELRERLAEVADLGRVARLTGWDQQVMMPPGGAPARAEMMGTLSKIIHEKFTDDRVGELLEELRPYEESLDRESNEASLVRVTRRDYEKARRVPTELRIAMATASSRALPVWNEAKQTSNFALLLPHLRENMELRKEYVRCFEPADEDYDILLDDFEPNMKTAAVREVFQTLKDELLPFIAECATRNDAIDDSILHGSFDPEKQRDLGLKVLRAFGYTDEKWRLDPTPHPFASNTSTDDIRLTTHYRDHDLNTLFANMHEFGHGVYEAQVDKALERTPLCRGVSLGLHESQSRLFENLVGRSKPFWRWAYSLLRETFPQQFSGVELDQLYAAVNKVSPSFIRIDADEVTYNFHVILRFELEQEILAGLDLADLPELWNAKMKEYLGIDVPDDARGVLQDMHWSGGHIGYFPTYSLGNIISVQIWEKALEAIPDLYEQFERGEFTPLREWLGENVHRYGRKFTPVETLEKIVGGPLDAKPYVRYLKSKLGEIYGLTPAGATR
jgi:carboxypeptidase Taq